MALPGTETIRFRRPTTGPNAVEQKKEPKKDEFGSLAPIGWKRRHQGLLQDQLKRNQQGPFIPSLSLALRLLLLVRTAAAMYSIISDCDEVFNFYEPLHYFQYNHGFQTWELSPQFAVRSWAYILLHWPLAHIGPLILGVGKRPAFFALRICLGAICSFCEAKFFRTVVETVNERVGRYLLFAMILSAGMWSASVAFLPSSFAMYTTMLASSYWFQPATTTPQGTTRTYRATFFYALGAIVGWPFSAALGIPFIFEQLFLGAGEIVPPELKHIWRSKRWDTMWKAVTMSASIVLPVYLIDSWVYGRPTLPTLNIITYNIFSGNGPDLYGTSPPTFYLANLFLNFNCFVPLALLSLPALAVTYKYDFRRLGRTQMAPREGETSPYVLLVTRLAPFYLWFAILTAQSHKEERFFFPAYPLLCFNAAVTIYLVRGWMEKVYIHLTRSPYNASRSSIFSNFTLLVVLLPCLLSVSRIAATYYFYHAPFDIVHHFQYSTLPGILSNLGYEPIPLPESYRPNGKEEEREVQWDLSPLQHLDEPVSICYGTEWHRFPGSYLIPEGVQVNFVQTEFDGMMPRKWEESAKKGRWPRSETRMVRPGRFNGENKASLEHGTFVDPSECMYMVALSMLSHTPTELEPDWTRSPEWEKEFCTTFLDGQSSKWWSRLIYLPWGLLDSGRVYGEYCLMHRKGAVHGA
ncbi:alpha-1,2-mannosyltransferase [Cryptococcus deuterogattii 2001/935-1]|nr:alpha-1,2-mannosyltransferase [Cryptococcus deuterogattii 2001/935-1]